LEPVSVKEVLKHSLSQFSGGSQVSLEDVDPEFGGTVDSRGLDEDTPDDIAGTADIEDYAVLLELVRFYTGSMKTKWGAMHTYTHMVIDEAQELSPLELNVLGHCLDPQGSVTVAGDAVQQTDPTSVFRT